jgi:hypothetical protein
VQNYGDAYASAYSSTALLAANTNEVIVAPASNINGQRLIRGRWTTGNGTGLQTNPFLAKASAPASLYDGDVVMLTQDFYANIGAAFQSAGRIEAPVFIVSGKGLYARNSGVVETAAVRTALYTLL